MLCKECGERPATFHMTRITNNRKEELHLCEVCAREHGDWEFMIEPKFSVHELLAGMLPVPARVGRAPAQEPSCEGCGLSYREFARTGLLGCSECYSTFEQVLEPILRRVHGRTRHEGKMPVGFEAQRRTDQQLAAWRRELQEAIADERFEDAATLRDQIRALDGEQEQQKQQETGGE